MDPSNLGSVILTRRNTSSATDRTTSFLYEEKVLLSQLSFMMPQLRCI